MANIIVHEIFHYVCVVFDIFSKKKKQNFKKKKKLNFEKPKPHVLVEKSPPRARRRGECEVRGFGRRGREGC